MGQERHWALAITAAAVLCLLGESQSADPVVRARVGGSAELSCSLTSTSQGASTPNLVPLHVVEWVRLGYNVPVLIKFGVYTPRVHPSYRGRVSLSRGASLRIDDLSLVDEGWFECRILLLDQPTDEFQNGTWTFLSITAPPSFVQKPPSQVEVLLGDPVILSCAALGNPKPTVSWRKGDVPAEEHEAIKVLNGTLSLAKVTRETSGLYKCHVSNSEGNLTHSTQLLVKGPPIIIMPPEDVSMNMSQDAVLPCQAEAHPANLTYEWWKDGENIYHIETLKSRIKVMVDGTLLISELIPEDSGNYTCVPTNGLLTPPSASAYLKVKHPARVVRMPRETYLPAGMEGVIVCPVQAEPPMLFVNWTKDGDTLNLDQFPGWMVNSEGSVFITTANDDAVGMYTCTAYNSYGTMGQSEPTKVILQDPPAFNVTPRAEYLQEVGRGLLIPCSAAGDPTPNITWAKVGPLPRSPYALLSNGSLLLRPLSKDHQGGWECRASNRVATVTAGTVVLVLGTSPHSVSSVSVVTEMHQANVSWEPGFDGGYMQKFSVWFKPTVRAKHEWQSLPVPTSRTHMLVTGLMAGTSYQFSVLPQNKLGSGPFSEIVTVRTIAPPTDPPTVVSEVAALAPPTLLSVNRTSEGILLQWVPPPADSLPITSFVLQARLEGGKWVTLDGTINANSSDMLVQGLLKDSLYDLRMLSRRDQLVSEPSQSVNISTSGMDVYPVHTSLLAFIPEPLLAGVIAGVCFLLATIVLSLVTICIMSRRRDRKKRKRRDDIPPAFRKNPSPEPRSPSNSPDSVLKMKLCPPLSFFPSSSSSSDRSSFDKGSRSEYHDQRKQLLSGTSPPPRYTLFESHLGGSPSANSALESIARGPDGRFVVQAYAPGSSPAHLKRSFKKDFPQSPGRGSFRDSGRASPLDADQEAQRCSPLALAVDASVAPHLETLAESPGRVRAMARNFSRHGCFYSDDEQAGSEALLERASFYSDSGEKRRSSYRGYRGPTHPEDLLPGLARRGRYQPMEPDGPLSPDGTALTHLEGASDSELSGPSRRRQRLVREREEMERELQGYTCGLRVWDRVREERRAKSVSPLRSCRSPAPDAHQPDAEPVWKPQDVSLRPRSQRPSSLAHRVSDYRRGCYFGSTSSPMERALPASASYITWDISPVSSPTSLVPPPHSLSEGNTPRAQRPLSPPSPPQDDLSLLSPTSHSPATSDPAADLNCGRSRRPDRPAERVQTDVPLRRAPVADLRDPDTGASSAKPVTPVCSEPLQPVCESVRHFEAEQERAASPRSSRSTSPTTLTPDEMADDASDEERHGDSRPRRTPSSYSTLPYEQQRSGGRVKSPAGGGHFDSPAVEELAGSSALLDSEREAVRARSRKSERLAFGGSPSRASPLTLLENESVSVSDQSTLSRVSESMKARLVPPPPAARLSPVQTSAILEYLSMPGFIEMSVDEPVDDSDATPTAWPPTADSEASSLLTGEPDVVPRNWGGHPPDGPPPDPTQQQSTVPDERKTPIIPVGQPSGPEMPAPRSAVSRHRSVPRPAPEPRAGDEEMEERRPDSTQPLLSVKTRSPARQAQKMGADLAHTLVSAARSVAAVATRSPERFERFERLPLQSSPEEEPRREPASRTNKIASRICQAPVPFMRKSMSIGPCRTLSGVGPPRPFLRKSISLATHSWEPLDEPRAYVSERYYRDELPHPDARVKSYSLGRAPPSCYGRPGALWHGLVPFHRHGSGSLERQHPVDRPYPMDRPHPAERPYPMDRPHPAERPYPMDRPHPAERPYPMDRPHPADRTFPVEHRSHPADRPYLLDHSYPPLDRHYPPERPYPPNRPYMLPSYLSPAPPILEDPRHAPDPPISTRHDWPDPRRQAAVFPDAARCPLTYQETLRAAQHKYVPLDPSYPLLPPRPGPKYPRPIAADPRHDHQRAQLPRGYSWPSPYQPAPLPLRELDFPREPREPDRALVPREVEYLRESREGRASYASQSSGHGSVGPYGHGGHLRQSVSMTPTLLSSPETTEESQRLRPDAEFRNRRAQRRNTSVDESYEWDAVEQCMDPDVLGGLKGEQGPARGGRGQEPIRDPPCSSPDPQDPHSKGLSCSLSPPPVSHAPGSECSRSLSEARFNALRQEFQEYCRAQESSCPREPFYPPSDPESDSNSALL
ncbi:uncharacterized protein igsf9b [Alosa sapidissima]|uniref:uncharacterized protein igsf9b n=1 Tax=Alosa sapidissima TaxID=34773 RepID=UPI001C08EEC6|nr:uncharacterized protein igsf9b [Alosa sapidissima]